MIAIGPDRDLLLAHKTPDGSIYYLHISGYVVAMRDGTFHALDAAQVLDRAKTKSRRRTYDAVCGAKVRLLPFKADGKTATALWPPRVSSLRDGATRCRECHEATGRKRPSGYFPPVEVTA